MAPIADLERVPYVVNYENADGSPGWHSVPEIEEAVRFVEHLRNADGLEDARIFKLEPVTFDFRPYFRVELAGGGTAPAGGGAHTARADAPAFAAHILSEPDAPAWPAADTLADALPSAHDSFEAEADGDPELDDDAAPANGARRGLFGR